MGSVDGSHLGWLCGWYNVKYQEKAQGLPKSLSVHSTTVEVPYSPLPGMQAARGNSVPTTCIFILHFPRTLSFK
jgi:hypothetical protein